MRILVTGGAGFIGSHVVRHLVRDGHEVCVANRNTYAASYRALEPVLREISLLHGDLAEPYFAESCAAWGADVVVHMAAETHVDRAIVSPDSFIRANVLGTCNLLQALVVRRRMPQKIVVYSTDEVFGSTPIGVVFDETAPYNPSNAYSASKVGVEALCRAFVVTHELPIVVVRPCNTYGPGQYPEKVIPKFVRQLLDHAPLTLYNDGRGARDWLYVEDHARAVEVLLENGEPGASYNLAAGDEHTDMEIAERVMALVGEMAPESEPHVVRHVRGRPGHDRRYWMDGSKLRALGWEPLVPFNVGLEKSVLWNIAHRYWWDIDEVKYVT